MAVWGAAAALLGLGLATALRRSLWLDEFHSLHHARNLARGLQPFFADLFGDNHPPLSFALLAASRAVFGESPLALRAPALLAGLAHVLLVAALARRLARTPDAPSRTWAPWLVVASSLQLTVASEARMYALLALATTALLAVLLDVVGGRRRSVALALVTAVGLLTHYYFVHALAVLGLAALWSLRGSEHAAARARQLALGAAGGLLLAAPWLVTGFRHQLLEHSVAPGGSAVSAQRLVEALVHLEFHQVSLGPAWAKPLWVAAGLVFLALLGRGAWLLVRTAGRSDSRQPERGAASLLVAGALLLPIWAALTAAWMPRAGFNWTYLSGSLGAAALLAAGAADGRGRVWAFAPALVVLPGLGLCLAIARSPGTEDTRGAVAWVHERLADAERERVPAGLVVADWQPAQFESGLAWRYYSEREEAAEAAAVPVALDLTADWDLARPGALEALDRLLLLERGLPGDALLWSRLRAEFPVERGVRFGYSLVALEFSR